MDRDYATNKVVDFSKPEEQVRQETEKWLIDELNYHPKQIDIEYQIRIGSKRPRVDLVIFKTQNGNKRNQHKDVLAFLEFKPSKTRSSSVMDSAITEAEEQLQPYMLASGSCEWGVAASSNVRRFYRKINGTTIERIHTVPPAGISIDQMVRLKKSDLKPVNNLKSRFKSILSHMYSNTNIQSRTRLCNEITKILFCKIYDEKLESDIPHFQVPPGKSHDEVKDHIEQNLWKKILDKLSMAQVFSRDERIILDSDSVCYVIGELERVSLLQTDCDAIGAAFEVFAEKYFVGEKGEFFTPRIAVKNAVKMLNPSYQRKRSFKGCLLD